MLIEMLLPDQRTIALPELSGLLRSDAAGQPFDGSVVDAVANLSQRIFHDREARRYPELQVLAFWMRKAEISRLAAEFSSLQSNRRLLSPRGLVFHLPPSNVDTMFVYSWLLSALVGNRSIIRLSPHRSESAALLLRLLRETLAEAAEPARSSTTIVSYDHEREPTDLVSAKCDVRVIWGGNETVETIRRSPLAPHAKDITFPDRYSLCAIQADAYADIPEEQRDYLAEQFFNDSFWFDQLACSSPRLVVWCGADVSATSSTSADFFPRVAAAAERRQDALPAAITMQKFVFACSTILRSPIESCRLGKALSVLTLSGLDNFPQDHPGGGMFLEVHMPSLMDLAPFLNRRHQTLTAFGFTDEELNGFIRQLNGKAIDRVVPIGHALQFHRFWDGYDLLQEFCRCVYLEPQLPSHEIPKQGQQEHISTNNAA
jgi:hypothetical protein